MNLYAEIAGTGSRDVLLIHGWASSSRMWDVIMETFASELCLWALDLPGFGRSPAPENAPTIEDHLQSVIAYCDQHELRPAAVIAHSMGGLIALRLALARPDLVPVLVLIAPVVTGQFGIQGIGQQFLRLRGADTLLRATENLWDVIRHDALIRLLAQVWHGESRRAQQIREDFMRVQPAAGIEALISMSQAGDLAAQLGQIWQPVLVMIGLRDVTVPPQEGKLAAQMIPQAELVTFPECRHHPHDEQSADFNAHLREFLKRQNVL